MSESIVAEKVANRMYRPYKMDPTGHKQIRDYEHMLQVLNHILTTAPTWTMSAEKVGMVSQGQRRAIHC